MRAPAETKAKIRELTKLAMQRPEVRQKVQRPRHPLSDDAKVGGGLQCDVLAELSGAW